MCRGDFLGLCVGHVSYFNVLRRPLFKTCEISSIPSSITVLWLRFRFLSSEKPLCRAEESAGMDAIVSEHEDRLQNTCTHKQLLNIPYGFHCYIPKILTAIWIVQVYSISSSLQFSSALLRWIRPWSSISVQLRLSTRSEEPPESIWARASQSAAVNLHLHKLNKTWHTSASVRARASTKND